MKETKEFNPFLVILYPLNTPEKKLNERQKSFEAYHNLIFQLPLARHPLPASIWLRTKIWIKNK